MISNTVVRVRSRRREVGTVGLRWSSFLSQTNKDTVTVTVTLIVTVTVTVAVTVIVTVTVTVTVTRFPALSAGTDSFMAY
jgi:hypothetical protein